MDILGPVDFSIPLKKGEVTILMMCGLQGSGKTTTCGKLSQLLKEQKASPFLVAADLQRPAAIEQLKTLGQQLDVPVYSDLEEKDPIKVCQAGVAQAKSIDANIVILDTAGRLAIDDELMKQLSTSKSSEVRKKIIKSVRAPYSAGALAFLGKRLKDTNPAICALVFEQLIDKIGRAHV